MKKNPIFFILISILLCLTTLLFFSCSKEETIEDRLYGSWRSYEKNVHTILTYHAQGTWAATHKVEGSFSKIVEKKGVVRGTWQVAGGKLEMKTDEAAVDVGWRVGETKIFEIVGEVADTLTLKNEVQRIKVWNRLKSDDKPKEDEAVEGGVVVNLGPMVVNLMKLRARSKERYLCVDLALQIESIEGVDFVMVIQDPQSTDVTSYKYEIHPRIKEAVLFYLSSLTYNKIKTFDKSEVAMNELKTILNPYLRGQINSVDIKNIVVTSKRKSVNDFINQFSVDFQIEPDTELDQDSTAEEGVGEET